MSTFAYELKHWSEKNCRFYLENNDLKFIQSILKVELQGLEIDDNLMEMLTQDNKLIKAILELPEQLPISTQFYFYILLKRAFEQVGIKNVYLINYITFILTLYIKSNSNVENNFLYISDFLKQIQDADNREKFYLRVELANKILVLTSLFETHMNYRTHRRAAPSISYYETIGCTQYEVATHHPLASELKLKSVFSELSNSFSHIRQVLSQFGERYISLGEPFSNTFNLNSR